MKNAFSTGRFCGTVAAAAIFLAGAASAQQTVISPNGGVTVHNRNGTTTRIGSGGVVTTGRAHYRHRSTVRVVRNTTLSGGNVAVTGNNRTLTITSRNGTVEVSGNNNKVTIKGTCERLMVSGNRNFVHADNIVDISATGNNNAITWRMSPTRSGSPGISRTGTDNTVLRRK